MSIDSCLKNLYFISRFVICTVKYTHTCALGTGFNCPVIHPSRLGLFIPTGAEKEWNTDAMWWRIIYISVVNFFLNFYFGFFGLRYTHPISFSTTERVGLGFFFFEILFRILEIFNAFYIVVIFYYSSMDARASSR
jgi:hypothetical protein